MSDGIWTDRSELDRINDNFEAEFDSIKKTIFGFKEYFPDYKIGNIALYSGNKMRQIYRYFHDKNVPYSESNVNRAIEFYFMDKYTEAAFYLKRFAEEILRKLPRHYDKELIRKLVLNSENIKEYNRLCDEVYNFDIEKDVDKAINCVIENAMFIQDYDEIDIIELVDDYNYELRKLGIDKEITYDEEATREMLYEKLREIFEAASSIELSPQDDNISIRFEIVEDDSPKQKK